MEQILIENEELQVQPNRRKRQSSRPPTAFETERQNIFKAVMELKRQKLASDIEKNKVKAEVYKAKLEILENYKRNNNINE